uniref:SET domain-containing protein n=1 Tax=Trieres chinensis TaxID=1514140 RepID=A0A7S2A866_TRICV
MVVVVVAAVALLLGGAAPRPVGAFTTRVPTRSVVAPPPPPPFLCRRPPSQPRTRISSLFATEESTADGATSSSSSSSDLDRLTALAADLNAALKACTPDYYKNVKVAVGPSSPPTAAAGGESHRLRLGLIATDDVRSGDVALSVPYDDALQFTAKGSSVTFGGILPEGYDGWTGDAGLIAMSVLNELARTAAADDGGGDGGAGVPLPKRKPPVQNLIEAWIKSLPTPSEMSSSHPLLWSEDDQEILQSSSTRKVYRTLDDVEEDAAWLTERVWDLDRTKFPDTVTLENGDERDCFNADGYLWAVAIVTSRAVFVDGALRLIPVLDMANHDDIGTVEVGGGTMGAFGTTKGAEIRTGRKYSKGQEVTVSYGPKSAAEYLLEHGFVPPRAKSTAVSELTFEIDEGDRFRDDKLDVLEFETYDSAPMEPVQSFDLVAMPGGGDGQPDPAMAQFLRLAKLGGKDAFLLESIFRKEIWEFMAYPVSETNEGDVCDAIREACEGALKGMEELESKSEDAAEGAAAGEDEDENSPRRLCAAVRTAERAALSRTLEYVERDRMALDLKEYYQERRLKDLGLDSEWSEDDDNPDVGWGQTRAPGSGDLDW